MKNIPNIFYHFDFYANIISKYLFYQFNDYIEAGGGQKQTIRHTAKVKHSIGLKKFEERERQAIFGRKNNSWCGVQIFNRKKKQKLLRLWTVITECLDV